MNIRRRRIEQDCPKCKYGTVDLFQDGSGVCIDCKAEFDPDTFPRNPNNKTVQSTVTIPLSKK